MNAENIYALFFGFAGFTYLLYILWDDIVAETIDTARYIKKRILERWRRWRKMTRNRN